jgi:predicted ATP-grasp superfamily ATP-dependent carboligase|tara:strand:- start:697 stop:1011 length:315 start_codon:yes stop_codon:yes gene_type:complete
MLSRFNLDVKRMSYYDDRQKFDLEFTINLELNNKKETLIEINEPQILFLSDSSLKINLTNQNINKDIILLNNQSISLIDGDKIKILTSNKNKVTNFILYKFKSP